MRYMRILLFAAAARFCHCSSWHVKPMLGLATPRTAFTAANTWGSGQSQQGVAGCFPSEHPQLTVPRTLRQCLFTHYLSSRKGPRHFWQAGQAALESHPP
jgi:hypothetical protein